MQPNGRVLVIGNSDGIGLETTRQLLSRGLVVTGVSRRASPLSHVAYDHTVEDLTAPNYPDLLRHLAHERGPFDACIYCAGLLAPTEIRSASVVASAPESRGRVRSAPVLVAPSWQSGFRPGRAVNAYRIPRVDGVYVLDLVRRANYEQGELDSAVTDAA